MVYIVLGALKPIITVSPPTATTVMLSWTMPPLSFPVNSFQLMLTRVTGSGQQLCGDFVDNRLEIVIGGSRNFSNLQESSVYSVRVTVNFQRATLGIVPSAFADIEFTTQSASKYCSYLMKRTLATCKAGSSVSLPTHLISFYSSHWNSQ